MLCRPLVPPDRLPTMAQTPRLSVGDTAPGFALPDAGGAVVKLSAYSGTKVVLYVYPAAMTPGCTKQAGDFRDNLQRFLDAGYAVIGLSPDKPEKLAAFVAKEGLTFPLLSDTSKDTLRAYGAYGEKQLYGKTVTGVIRSTFLIDKVGVLTSASYAVKATGHVAKLLKDHGL